MSVISIFFGVAVGGASYYLINFCIKSYLKKRFVNQIYKEMQEARIKLLNRFGIKSERTGKFDE